MRGGREAPFQDMQRAVGAAPVAILDAWARAGLAAASWSVSGPREFPYATRPEHMLTFVTTPVAQHSIMVDGQRRRTGPIEAGRFRIAQGGIATTAEVSSPDPVNMLQLYIAPKQVEELLRPTGIGAGAVELTDPQWDKDDPVVTTMVGAIAAVMACGHPVDQLCADQMSLALTAYVLRTYSNVTTLPTGQHRGGLAGWRLRRVLDRMTDGLAERLTVAELAGVAGYSPAHFCHAFKASVGATPHAYLMRRRAEAARLLLTTGPQPLNEIARTCGFADQPHMNAVFRKVYGQTPKRVRDEAERPLPA